MNFGNFPPLPFPAAYVGGSVIIHSENGILTCRRRGIPWLNYISVGFGGYVDPSDRNVLATAVREVKEETGLLVKIEFLVGIYGPECFHYSFHSYDGRYYAVAAKEAGHIRPVISFVFAGRPVEGELKDSTETAELCWRRPDELVGKNLAFFDALLLANFLNAGPALRDMGKQFLRFIQ